MKATELLDEVIEAHGGKNRWQGVNRIQASLSSGGLAFTMHCQPFALQNLQISVSPNARMVELRNYCRPNWRGIWTPTHVQILDEENRTVQERTDPRNDFSRPIKKIKWDRLDLLYFAGYALWNYLSFPFILELPGVHVAGAEERADGAARLTATFDAAIPTHSAVQTFHFGRSRHLTRHDYTADVIGRWATAANYCLASEQVSGLLFYTRRKVYPRLAPSLAVLPFPTFVWIEINEIEVHFAEPASDTPSCPAP